MKGPSIGAIQSSGMVNAFIHINYPNPHAERAHAILKRHPEVRALIGADPRTFMAILGLVGTQVLVAWLLRDAPAWAIAVGAYGVGACVNVCLLAMIHEACHGLIFRTLAGNRLAAFIANVPTFFPAAESFIRYHKLHHQYLGEYDRDVSIPRKWEARCTERSSARKTLWVMSYWLLYPIRLYALVASRDVWNRWTLANWCTQIAFNVAVAASFGYNALLYFFLSFAFSFGLHPLNAMTVQEHSMIRAGQDTYSYYGFGNYLTFNSGYHHEHHDLPGVPWLRLPQLRSLASEFYEPLTAYRSWTALLIGFIWNPAQNLWQRGVRR
jgi:sphingolipid delta-4 desaturase